MRLKAVARAERLEAGVLADEILHASEGVCRRDVIGAVFDVAGPSWRVFSGAAKDGSFKRHGGRPAVQSLMKVRFFHGWKITADGGKSTTET